MSVKGKIAKIDNRNKSGFAQCPENINRKGAPKKIKTILKEKGYQPIEIKEAFAEIAFCTEKELNDLCGKAENPIIIKIIANQYREALDKGDWTKIKEIIEHVIGKPTQQINAQVTAIQTPTIIIQRPDND